MQMTGAARARV